MAEAGWQEEVPDGPSIRAAVDAAAQLMQFNWLHVNAAHDKRDAQNLALRAKKTKPVDYQMSDFVLVRAMLPRSKLRVAGTDASRGHGRQSTRVCRHWREGDSAWTANEVLCGRQLAGYGRPEESSPV